ncbi:MAG: nicotinamide-nucleotide amidohydrolase family protein [Clostridia bacterium]|nr:nicotinamide-nucleotide amidohydrolase family protein [Clostridia bacterium]
MMATDGKIEYRLFGLSEEAVRRRLEQAPSALSAIKVLHEEEHTVLTLPATEGAQEAALWLDSRFGVYVYSREGQSLPQRVVELLAAHGLTLSTAESCTGGMVAQQLTSVPGCSKVFGTGVVSYSNACKQELLGVEEETLAAFGAVSGQTAEEMARGIRRRSGASLGVSVTGEAGPLPSEEHPVGTVFVALADAKRTWVKELHLDAPERERDGIRRVASAHVLDLVRRYLEAYPAVMAGAQTRRSGAARQIPDSPVKRSLVARLLPWRGDSRRRLLVKALAWLGALAVLLGGMLAGYRYLLAPGNNRELQTGLGELYWSGTEDLTEGDTVPAGAYPQGMMVQFRGLYDRNADVCGWIRIPDTSIDYPVMNYHNGYYQTHNFMDQYSLYGQPYFDEDTVISPLAADRTMTIYGKNTGDGQMFSDLLSYRRVAYLREHPLIEMNTLFATGRWEIFAVAVADERNKTEFDYARSAFTDDGDFEEYLKDLRRRSLFHADSTVTAKDRLLLLSVDAQQVYGFSGARLVVAARRLTGESTVSYRVNNSPRMPSVMANQRRTTTTTVDKGMADEAVTTIATTATTDTTATTADTTTTASEVDATTVTQPDSTTTEEDGADDVTTEVAVTTKTNSSEDSEADDHVTGASTAPSDGTTTQTEAEVYADIRD